MNEHVSSVHAAASPRLCALRVHRGLLLLNRQRRGVESRSAPVSAACLNGQPSHAGCAKNGAIIPMYAPMETASSFCVSARGDFLISPRRHPWADMWQGLRESAEFPTGVKDVVAIFGLYASREA